MHFLLLLVALSLSYVDVKEEIDFIVDYFVHKEIKSVVGITCYDVPENFLLTKALNEKNIAVTTSKSINESNFPLLVEAMYWKVGIFVDSRCLRIDKISSLFEKATDYRLFDELRCWLIIGNNSKQMLSVINDTAFGISTDFVITTPTIACHYELFDIYNIFKERGAALNVTYYGDWRCNVGLTVHLRKSKFRRRSNLHGLLLKAMFYKSNFRPTNIPLEEYYEDYEHATRDSQSKFSFHVLKYMSDMYNFSLDSKESPRWQKGDKVGPIERALVNYDIDISGTPISVSVRRLKTMKYLHYGWPFRSCFLFRNPKPCNVEVGQIFRPLANKVWYLTGFFVSISVAILLIALRHDLNEADMILFFNSSLIVIGALCQQSTDTKLVRISTRIIFFSVMIFSLLIFNYYSASVVSARLDSSASKINNSLVQLGKLNLKMATEDMVYFEYFIKKPDWDTVMFYENYWKKIPEYKKYLETDVGMRLVQKGGFAYHTHIEIAYLYIGKFFDHREICEITEIDLGGPLVTYFSVHYNSTLVDIGRIGLLRISETGLRIREIHKWLNRKPQCRKEILSATSITIYEFAPHLILLFSGTVLSVIVLAAEIFVTKNVFSVIQLRYHSVIEGFMSCGQIQIEE